MVGTYLMFNGNCKEALEMYEKAFNVKIEEIQKYGDIPPNPNFPVSDDMKERILHSRFVLDGVEIMCADSSSEMKNSNNMYISITAKKEKIVIDAWNILKESGTIYMDLQPSFFSLYHDVH